MVGSLFFSLQNLQFQTFVLYPYIEEKPLRAAKVFSCLALFNILSLPLYLVTMIINIMSHAKVSTDRLSAFLLAPEIEAAEPLSTDRQADLAEVSL